MALPKIDFVITHRNSWILFQLFHYQIKACEFVFCLVSNRLQFRKLFLQIKTSEMTNKIVSSLYLMWSNFYTRPEVVKRCNKHTRIDDIIYERFHDIVGQGGQARPEPQGDRSQGRGYHWDQAQGWG